MKRFPLLAVAALALFAVSCAGGRHLRTEPVRDSKEISGTFDLILYGGRYLDDLETVAFLDLKGDGYALKPFAPEFDFKTLKSLSAKDAIGEAHHHVSFHPSFVGTWLRMVLDERGTRVIGYELRPLYGPTFYGGLNVLEVDYWLKEEGKVKVVIRLKERVERYLMDEGNSFIWGSYHRQAYP
jgi:hypothetical protein